MPPPPAAAPAPKSEPAPKPEPGKEPFGQDITLEPKTIIYLKGNGSWDTALETLQDAFKSVYALIEKQGLQKAGAPMTKDAIFRLYSMTKPFTSLAIMMLYEEGLFQLDDPISRFLPCFANARVYSGGSRGKLETVPAERGISFRDLLTQLTSRARRRGDDLPGRQNRNGDLQTRGAAVIGDIDRKLRMGRNRDDQPEKSSKR